MIAWTQLITDAVGSDVMLPAVALTRHWMMLVVVLSLSCPSSLLARAGQSRLETGLTPTQIGAGSSRVSSVPSGLRCDQKCLL